MKGFRKDFTRHYALIEEFHKMKLPTNIKLTFSEGLLLIASNAEKTGATNQEFNAELNKLLKKTVSMITHSTLPDFEKTKAKRLCENIIASHPQNFLGRSSQQKSAPSTPDVSPSLNVVEVQDKRVENSLQDPLYSKLYDELVKMELPQDILLGYYNAFYDIQTKTGKITQDINDSLKMLLQDTIEMIESSTIPASNKSNAKHLCEEIITSQLTNTIEKPEHEGESLEEADDFPSLNLVELGSIKDNATPQSSTPVTKDEQPIETEQATPTIDDKIKTFQEKANASRELTLKYKSAREKLHADRDSPSTVVDVEHITKRTP